MVSKLQRKIGKGWWGVIALALILIAAMLIPLSLASRPPYVHAEISIAGASPSSCWDPVKGHCYPRRGMQLWGGAPFEWFAKFDLVMTRSSNPAFAQGIKDLSPTTYVLAMYDDMNVGGGVIPVPQEWCLRGSDKDHSILDCSAYNADEAVCWANFSDFSGRSPQYGNLKYYEFIGGYFGSHYSPPFDGMATDGFWEKPWIAMVPDVDLEGDQRNDWEQYGEQWLIDQWGVGRDRILNDWRVAMGSDKTALGNDKIILINSGYFHTFNWEEAQGLYLEHQTCEYNFGWTKYVYDGWMSTAPAPHALMYSASRANSKEDYVYMRFHLGRVMYGDGYAQFADYRSSEYYYVYYYDEMDLNLGWPTGPMRLVRDTQEAGDYNDEGVYVRFFDYGAVILNMDDRPQTVTNSDLISMPGYNGPYYRFQGGQNPSFNDGSVFNQVSLNGIWDEDCLVGDGIILTKNPTVMVSDIYIDNDNEDTSPGQPTASLIGNWQDNAGNDNECRYVKKAWAQGCRDWPSVGVQQLALAYTTDNSARAVYTPTINVPGQYEVFEWHGDRTDATEATNVRHLLRDMTPVSVAANCSIVSGGADCIVNQRENQGQWNSLGIYTFNAGTQGHVTISAQGASGTVIADAIKFVYQGNHGNIKGEPVSPFEDINLDGRIDILDLQLAINVLLGVEKDSGIIARADVNRDGQVNRADIQQIGSRILSKR